jgi:hypothetical protein
MACDYQRQANQTEQQRQREIKEALAKLKRALTGKSVTVQIGPNGAVYLMGWSKEDRAGVSDACAVRKLQAENSPELRRAIAAAEATSGRKVNMQTVNSGVHSHDGKNWDKGH